MFSKLAWVLLDDTYTSDAPLIAALFLEENKLYDFLKESAFNSDAEAITNGLDKIERIASIASQVIEHDLYALKSIISGAPTPIKRHFSVKLASSLIHALENDEPLVEFSNNQRILGVYYILKSAEEAIPGFSVLREIDADY